MYSLLLITHLIGLSISAGTSVYLGALSRYAQRHLDQTEAKTLMPGISGAVSAVGNIGLAILLLSGLAMAFIIGFSGLTTVFWVKMTLVAAIIGYVGVMNYWAAKVRRGKPDYARRMKKLAVIGAPLGLITIAAAVVAFH